MTQSRGEQQPLLPAVHSSQPALPESEELHRAQKIAKQLIPFFVDGVAGTVFLTSILPGVPNPFDVMMDAGVSVFAYTAGGVIRVLSNTPRPCADLTWLTPVKYLAATIPPVLAGLAIGWAVRPMEAPSSVTSLHNSQALALGGAPLSLIAFISGKFVFDRCFPPGEAIHRSFDETTATYQKALKFVFRPAAPLAMYESLRLLLIELECGLVLHHPYFPVVILAFDQLLQLGHYLTSVPRPFDRLVPREQWEEFVVRDRTFNGGVMTRTVQAPSIMAIVKSLAPVAARSVAVLGLAGFAAMELANLVEGGRDNEAISNAERLINLGVMVEVAGAVEVLFDLGSRCLFAGLEKVSQWSIFNCRKGPVAEIDVIPDLEQGLSPSRQN